MEYLYYSSKTELFIVKKAFFSDIQRTERED